MPNPKIINVLFLCTANSARSILAEALLNHAGDARLRAHSAGSKPKGTIHPTALALLRQHGVPTAGLRSKSWNEFAAPGATTMDFIIAVCDKAAREPCPVWPGNPITAEWGLPDPAAIEDDAEQRRAFGRVFTTLQRRIGMLASAQFSRRDRARLERMMIEIRDHAPIVED